MNKYILCLALVFALPARADTWNDWQSGFTQTINACAIKDGACLNHTFTATPLPAPDSTSANDLLLRDLRAAQVMLHQPDASSLLWKLYGIDSSAYLGTGYSVPLNGPQARQYAFARQREYFVPNLCAETIDTALCPARASNLWVWKVTPQQLARWLDKPVAQLLAARRPLHDAAGFNRARRAPATNPDLPRLLIRFSPVPDAFYKGQVGRGGAARVFFGDYDQARAVTLRDFITATGTTGLDAPPPGTHYYVWLLAPGADVRQASWDALFKLLAQP